MNNYKDNSQYVKNIFARIKSAYNLDSDQELAAFLHIRSNTLAMQQKRGNVDFGLVLEACAEQDLNWLLRGDEIRTDATDEAAHYSAQTSGLQDRVRHLEGELASCRHELEKAQHEAKVLQGVIESLRPLR